MTDYRLETTPVYDDWLENLKDRQARAVIELRMRRAEEGNLGDHKSVGHGISEMRVHIGTGYRLYYTVRDRQIIFLLLGGDKNSQKADIAAAKKIKKELFPRSKPDPTTPPATSTTTKTSPFTCKSRCKSPSPTTTTACLPTPSKPPPRHAA